MVVSLNKGPFSYSGNKSRIWKTYLREEMCKYDRVHEFFLGSGVCVYNANNGGVATDKDPHVVALHHALQDKQLHVKVENVYRDYFPNGNDKSCYNKLRIDFNKEYNDNGITEQNVPMLYTLLQLSFNSLLRFGPNGYNVPFGDKNLDVERIRNHSEVFRNKNISVKLGSYDTIELDSISKENDVIYLDPPYVASKFQYGGWNDSDEVGLLKHIDTLSNNGYSFILSNTFSHRGVNNDRLIEWSRKYNTRFIKMTYNAWASRVSSVSNERNTVEVIITNISSAFNDLPHAHQRGNHK